MTGPPVRHKVRLLARRPRRARTFIDAGPLGGGDRIVGTFPDAIVLPRWCAWLAPLVRRWQARR